MNLEFAALAREYFDPLAKRYGMTLASSEYWKIRYEGARAVLEITFDGTRSYELSVWVGQRLPEGDARYSLELISDLPPNSEEARIGCIRATDEESLRIALKERSEVTVRVASDLLRGDRRRFVLAQAWVVWKSLKYAWDTQKRDSAIAAYRSLQTKEAWPALEKSLSGEDLRILEEAKSLAARFSAPR